MAEGAKQDVHWWKETVILSDYRLYLTCQSGYGMQRKI